MFPINNLTNLMLMITFKVKYWLKLTCLPLQNEVPWKSVVYLDATMPLLCFVFGSVRLFSFVSRGNNHVEIMQNIVSIAIPVNRSQWAGHFLCNFMKHSYGDTDRSWQVSYCDYDSSVLSCHRNLALVYRYYYCSIITDSWSLPPVRDLILLQYFGGHG